MSAQILQLPRTLVVDANGTPLVGSKLYVYKAGTSTALTVYKDADLSIEHTSPILSDSNGTFPPIYLDPSTGDAKINLTTSADVQISGYPLDDIPVGFSSAAVALALDSLKKTAAETSAEVTVINYAYAPGNAKRYGAKGDGTTDDTDAVQAAHDQGAEAGGARPYLPAGKYLISTTISPCQLGMVGDGAKRSRLVCDTVDAFTIAKDAGWDRNTAVFERFGIDSNDGTSCDGKYAFKFPGVASSATAVYNSGFTARDLDIGRNDRMGGGFYLKDLFDTLIENISMTDVSYGIRLVGSVVQLTAKDIHYFGDSAGTTLDRKGLSTESATYSSGTLTPEHITTHDCCWVTCDTGVDHQSGLDCNFYDTDVQAITTGLVLNAPCDVIGGIIIPDSTADSWVGVAVGVNPASPKDARYIKNVDISTLNTPGTVSSSYGIDIGDGTSSAYGVIIRDCRIKGNAASLENLIRARLPKDLTVEDCVMDHAAANSTDVLITSAQRVFINRNRCPGGEISVADGGDTTAYGSIEWNEVTTVATSLTASLQWSVQNNEPKTVASISAATSADPIVFTTSAAHGLATGDKVKFASLPGDFGTNLNTEVESVTVVTTTTFSVDIDGSAYTDYTSGGTATRQAEPGLHYPQVNTKSVTWDPGSLTDGSATSTTVTLTGANVGDGALAAFPIGSHTMFLSAHVQATDTVRVNLLNSDGSTVDLASGTLSVWVFPA